MGAKFRAPDPFPRSSHSLQFQTSQFTLLPFQSPPVSFFLPRQIFPPSQTCFPKVTKNKVLNRVGIELHGNLREIWNYVAFRSLSHSIYGNVTEGGREKDKAWGEKGEQIGLIRQGVHG